MFCPSCGTNAKEGDLFCTSCGKSFAASQEIELHSFGPWGVNTCFSRPGTFVWMQKNNTKVILTNQRISGLSSFNNSPRFQVNYSDIIAKENFDYRLNLGPWKVLWLKYREAEKIKEVSIMCFGPASSNITTAFEIIQNNSPRI